MKKKFGILGDEDTCFDCLRRQTNERMKSIDQMISHSLEDKREKELLRDDLRASLG